MESMEIQLARLDERMRMMLERMDENHLSNENTRRWMVTVDQTLQTISSRVTNVEASLAKSAPTIEEFLIIKHKILGAGFMGRWLWVTFGTLLGLVISAREHIIRIFAGGQ